MSTVPSDRTLNSCPIFDMVSLNDTLIFDKASKFELISTLAVTNLLAF